MGNNKPFLILICVVVVSVAVAAILSRVETRKATLEAERLVLVSDAGPEPAPTPTHDPEDFSTTRRIAKDEALAYYDAIQKRASEYATVQIRTVLELPQFVDDEVVEAEVRFDAVRPDKWAKQIFASRPENKIDPDAEWTVAPRSGTLATRKLFREIDYDTHTAYDTALDATEEYLRPFFEKKLRDLDEQFANPYLDLFAKIPIEDRLREIVGSEEVKTSEGPEVRVLMRVNSVTSQEISRGKLRTYFPVCPDCAKAVSLRQDVFDAETMELKRTEYMKPDQTSFLIQRYTRIVWDEEIPEDRFDLPLPEGERIFDIVADQRKKVERFRLEGDPTERLDREAAEMRRLLHETEDR